MKEGEDIRRIQKVFEKYRHKYEPYSLFERFLEYVIAGFDITMSPIARPYEKEEAEACQELMREWLLAMQEQLQRREWYDLLGEVYMQYLSSTMKKHWTGQYFTPMHMCDMMAAITDVGKKERVLDNACGSGRMLLAAHSENLGNYCCAQDLDRICCLMTVCNFIIHGINGEVVWGNGLDPTDYREGWRTNEMLNMIGVPCVRKMEQWESFLRYGLTQSKNDLEPTSEEQKPEPAPDTAPSVKATPKEKKKTVCQLSLFDDF